jgi:hypothetical protein
MVDPGRQPRERRNLNAPLWGVVMIFVVVMVGLAAYGYATRTWETSPAHQSDQSQPAKP